MIARTSIEDFTGLTAILLEIAPDQRTKTLSISPRPEACSDQAWHTIASIGS